VDLRVQAVEDADLVTGGGQPLHDERADEPGATGDEDTHRISGRPS
jgi:hypothetical protein